MKSGLSGFRRTRPRGKGRSCRFESRASGCQLRPLPRLELSTQIAGAAPNARRLRSILTSLFGFNCVGESAETGDGDFDAVAGFERSYARRRAGEQQVAGLKSED